MKKCTLRSMVAAPLSRRGAHQQAPLKATHTHTHTQEDKTHRTLRNMAAGTTCTSSSSSSPHSRSRIARIIASPASERLPLWLIIVKVEMAMTGTSLDAGICSLPSLVNLWQACAIGQSEARTQCTKGAAGLQTFPINSLFALPAEYGLLAARHKHTKGVSTTSTLGCSPDDLVVLQV